MMICFGRRRVKSEEKIVLLGLLADVSLVLSVVSRYLQQQKRARCMSNASEIIGVVYYVRHCSASSLVSTDGTASNLNTTQCLHKHCLWSAIGWFRPDAFCMMMQSECNPNDDDEDVKKTKTSSLVLLLPRKSVCDWVQERRESSLQVPVQLLVPRTYLTEVLSKLTNHLNQQREN